MHRLDGDFSGRFDAGGHGVLRVSCMIPKSGYRFSDKIMHHKALGTSRLAGAALSSSGMSVSWRETAAAAGAGRHKIIV